MVVYIYVEFAKFALTNYFVNSLNKKTLKATMWCLT